MPAIAATPTAVLKARSTLGNASKRGDSREIAEARRNLAAAKLRAYVARMIEESPDLTPEQRAQVADMLVGGAAA